MTSQSTGEKKDVSSASESQPTATVEQAAPLTDAGGPLSQLRGTAEYAAAFDVEIWKAEECKKFHLKLDQELAQKRRELELEYASRDVERLKEIDTMRRDLQDMGKQLQTAGRVLQKKLTNVERREEAFDARRLTLAQEAEVQLRSIEAKHRHVLEEAIERQNQLKAALRDRDLLLEQAQQRATSLQNEYDQLQRTMTRLHTDRNQDACVVVELRNRIDSLVETIKQLEAERNTRTAEAETMSREKAALEGTCRLLEQKLREALDAFRTLQNAYHREREAYFTAEKERFAASVREQDMMRHWHQAAAPQTAYRHRWDFVASSLQGERENGDSSVPHPQTELSALRALVEDLRREAASVDEREKTRKKKHRTKSQRPSNPTVTTIVPLHYAEAPPQGHTGGSSFLTVSGNTASPEALHHHRDYRVSSQLIPPSPNSDGPHHPSQLERPLREECDGTNVTVSTNSSPGGAPLLSTAHTETLGAPLSDVGLLDVSVDGERLSFVSAPTPTMDSGCLGQSGSSYGGYPSSKHLSSADAMSAAATHHNKYLSPSGPLGDTVSPALSVSQLSVTSWRPQMSVSAYDRDTFTDTSLPAAVTDASTASHGGVSEPLRPRAVHPPSTSSSSRPSGGESHGAMSPQQADSSNPQVPFAADASIIAGDSMTDIRAFVTRLVDNRRRLLETGVYQDQDAIIVEMDKKIRLYEHYLRAHFA